MALVQTLTKMLRHEHSVVHDPDGDDPVAVSYTPDEEPVSYCVIDSAGVRTFRNPKNAAIDFIATVGDQNARSAIREAQLEARNYAATRTAETRRRRTRS